MSADKAMGYYSNRYGTGRLNCSQAVMAAFREKFNVHEDTVSEFAGYGSGRAPDGVCGALHAARFLLKDKHKDRIKEFESHFEAGAGSTKCREIRKLRKLPCIGCVQRSAEFVENIDGKGGVVNSQGSTCQDMKCANGLSVEGKVRLSAGIMVIAGTALSWFVHPAFAIIPVFVGCGLVYAGLTDNCLMTVLFTRMER